MLLDEINKSLKMFKSPLVHSNVVLQLVSLLNESLKMQHNLKNKLIKQVMDEIEDFDQKEKEDFEDEYEALNDIMQSKAPISHIILYHRIYSFNGIGH